MMVGINCELSKLRSIFRLSCAKVCQGAPRYAKVVVIFLKSCTIGNCFEVLYYRDNLVLACFAGCL